jgi:hypothetical protein
MILTLFMVCLAMDGLTINYHSLVSLAIFILFMVSSIISSLVTK